MTLTATCHCGATKLEVQQPPTHAGECNCTYCSRTGAVWGYYQPDEVKVVSEADGKIYSANGFSEHHFCGKCGMQTYGVSPDWSSMYNSDGTPKNGDPTAVPTAKIYGINLKLIDDFDWSSVTIEKMDGRNSW